MPFIEGAKVGERWMGKRPAQVVLNARQMLEVTRLAVALRQPYENAEDLRVPLRSRNGVGFLERGAIERTGSRCAVGVDYGPLHFRRDVDTCIHRERRHVEGSGSERCILHVDDA